MNIIAKNRWTLITVGIAIIAMLWIAAMGRVILGSVENTVDFLGGDRIFAISRTMNLGDLSPGSPTYRVLGILNLSNRDTIIYGANSSCDCAVATGLPFSVPAYGRRNVRLKIHPKSKKGEYEMIIKFFHDHSSRKEVSVRVRWSVGAGVKPESDAGQTQK